MADFRFYGSGLPGVKLEELQGKLIVVEGTDGVGRTTQVDKLRFWLEQRGHAVLDTGLTRSALAGKGLKQAKQGNTLNLITHTLVYATDFADRLENQIIPALRAGFIVLTDRYIYSQIARAVVRGADESWARDVFSIALVPTAIFYLKANIDNLVPRVAFNRDQSEAFFAFFDACAPGQCGHGGYIEATKRYEDGKWIFRQVGCVIVS